MTHDNWTEEALERIIADLEAEAQELEHDELIDLLDRLSEGEY